MTTELTISKANSFVEASYQMTLDEMRVLSLTLGVFDPTNPKRGFDFTVAEFCEHFPDVNPDIAYVQVQKAIRKISSRWMTLQNDERVLHEVAFVTDRVYFKKEGRFYIEFHEKLLPYIANLKARYTKYELINIGAFTSTHTIRLYELCSQYKTVGQREIKLEDFKDWLQVKDKYPRYNSFNQRVLSPAVDEINAKSDLLVSFEPIKRGRSIHALKFVISTKSKAVNNPKKCADHISEKLTRRPFPHKNKFGKYVSLDREKPGNSSAEYANYAKACLAILDEDYHNIADVTPQDLCYYWVFLSVNASFRSKFGRKKFFLDTLKERGYKIDKCKLVKLEK